MAARNAYILSGIMHLAAIGLILITAGRPSSPIRPMLRYQPVRLVALPGKSDPAATKQESKIQARPAEEKPKPKPKAKAKSTAVTKKSTGVKEQEKTEKLTESTAAGSGGLENIRLEGAVFPFPYYLSNIQIKILSNFKPAIRAKEAEGLKTVVYFLVNRSGAISDVKLEKKSGHFLFDQEAQRAILRSNPLPALPPAFGSDRLGVHFEFIASE